MSLAALFVMLSGCGQPADPWNRYAESIDEHIEAYVEFSEPDTAISTQILNEYERAKQIRAAYHRDGTIPDDPLVHVITAGDNYFRFENNYVGVFLAPDRSLECAGLDFAKHDGLAGQFVVVGGNTGFWDQRDEDAKFISTTVTLPPGENTLKTHSNSWSPGKIILIGKAAGAALVVLGLTGCRGDEPEQAPTNPPDSCAPPTPAVSITKGTIFSANSFGTANSADAQQWLVDNQPIAQAALATKKGALSAGACITPCIPKWTPEPAVTSHSVSISGGFAGGAIEVDYRVPEDSNLSCVRPG